MLTATAAESALARATRLRWPACRKPMVGTRPRSVTSPRAARISATVSMIRMATLRPNLGQRLSQFVSVHAGALRVRREAAVLDVGRIGAHGRLHGSANLRIALGMPWRGLEQPQQVMPDLHLAVAAGAG